MNILDGIGGVADLISDLAKDGSIADTADLISKLSKNGSIQEVADLVSRLSKDKHLKEYVDTLINDMKPEKKPDKPEETQEAEETEIQDSEVNESDNCGETTISFPPGTDAITDLTYLHPKIQSAVKTIMEQIKITILETFRTPERQDKLYALGRTESGQIVTKARSFESYHNYGLALDVAPVTDTVVQLFESSGFEWGGRWKTFKDTPHFQMTFGLSVSDLKKLYDKGNLQAVWDHIGY